MVSIMKSVLTVMLLWAYIVTPFVEAGAGDPYKGHKVIGMVATTNESASMMEDFLENNKKHMDVWLQTPLTSQVQVSDNKVAEIKTFCEKWNITMTVHIDDLKTAIDKQIKDNGLTMPIVKHSKDRQEKIFNYTKYNRFEDIQNELYRLQCDYPSLVNVVHVGRSYEGRPLLLIKVSQNVLSECSSNKKIIWIDGGTHAREWISVATPMYMLHELITKFGEDESITNLLKNNVVYIAPVINPDGYEYTFTDDRLWRKTRTPNLGSSCFGTDPNRNWDSMWGPGPFSSSDPCDIRYHGTAPESEPVVKAYANVLRYLHKRIKTFWTLHSFAQAILYANSYTSKPPADIVKIEIAAVSFLTAAVKKFKTLYIPGTSISVLRQVLNGVANDYMHDTLKVSFSYTLELRPVKARVSVGFLLPANEIAPTSQEVLCGILGAIKSIDTLV